MIENKFKSADSGRINYVIFIYFTVLFQTKNKGEQNKA